MLFDCKYQDYFPWEVPGPIYLVFPKHSNHAGNYTYKYKYNLHWEQIYSTNFEISTKSRIARIVKFSISESTIIYWDVRDLRRHISDNLESGGKKFLNSYLVECQSLKRIYVFCLNLYTFCLVIYAI